MDTKKIGLFLAQLRKEQNLTQEELGARLGVTNKTVSRWEQGNYLPPAEMLQALSELYGLTINELLSGERLDKDAWREKAEENITAVMVRGDFSRREKRLAAGEWLRRRWWFVFLCLAPALLLYSLLPFAVTGVVSLAAYAAFVLAVGLMLVCGHVVAHVTGRAYAATKDKGEFRTLMLMRAVWLAVLGVSLFITVELGLSTLHAMTPAGTADGYAVSSMFYDILIADGGSYPDNCWIALRRSAWQTFAAAVINLDLTFLWMKHR